MKQFLTLLVLTASGALSSWAQAETVSPFAAPPTVFRFQEATAENFPYSKFIRQQNQLKEFKNYGNFKFHRIDLNNDGKDEWIVAMKEEYPRGPLSIWIFEERDGKLVHILKCHPYFTIIPKRGSYPDIEDWYHVGSQTSRQRWTYDEKKACYKQLWAEYYFDHVIVETIVLRY